MGIAAQKNKGVDDDEYIVQSSMVDENAAELRENAALWRECFGIFFDT